MAQRKERDRRDSSLVNRSSGMTQKPTCTKETPRGTQATHLLVTYLKESVDLHISGRQPRLLVAREAVRVDRPPLCGDDGREHRRHDEGHEVCISRENRKKK